MGELACGNKETTRESPTRASRGPGLSGTKGGRLSNSRPYAIHPLVGGMPRSSENARSVEVYAIESPIVTHPSESESPKVTIRLVPILTGRRAIQTARRAERRALTPSPCKTPRIGTRITKDPFIKWPYHAPNAFAMPNALSLELVAVHVRKLDLPLPRVHGQADPELPQTHRLGGDDVPAARG